LTLFIHYLGWVIGLTGHLGDFILEFKRSGVSLQRLQALVPDSPGRSLVSSSSDFPAAVKGEQQQTPAALSVRGLAYRYGSSDNGIQPADLEVEPGQLTVITGSMGVGKTTLLRSILGLLPAQSGQVQWNGKDVSTPALFFVPPRCAYVAQAPRLFSGSLTDNITLGLEATQEQVLNVVRNAVLERDVHSMSEGIETRVGPRGLRLSGGQVQRTALAVGDHSAIDLTQALLAFFHLIQSHKRGGQIEFATADVLAAQLFFAAQVAQGGLVMAGLAGGFAGDGIGAGKVDILFFGCGG